MQSGAAIVPLATKIWVAREPRLLLGEQLRDRLLERVAAEVREAHLAGPVEQERRGDRLDAVLDCQLRLPVPAVVDLLPGHAEPLLGVLDLVLRVRAVE